LTPRVFTLVVVRSILVVNRLRCIVVIELVVVALVFFVVD
jgi:hypothetical protein